MLQILTKDGGRVADPVDGDPGLGPANAKKSGSGSNITNFTLF